jgi:cephalosporin-C deacetylase
VKQFAPELPEDFDEFWSETYAEANESKLDFSRSADASIQSEGFKIELISFRSIEGGKLSGWYAVPDGGARRSRCFLWLPYYGRESCLPDQYSTRPGFVSMSFNFWGHDAFYKEPYQVHRGYMTHGIDDPRTSVFRRLSQDAFIAIRVLRSQLEADEDRLAVMGLSQGGGLALSAGANSPHVSCVVADLPFLCGMKETLSRQVYRYPLKEITDYATTIPLGMERVLYTLSYFDSVNQATRAIVPTLVGYGKQDPSCKPSNVREAFKGIPVKKKIVEYSGGHDWDPLMVDTNLDWLLENLP